MKSVVGLYENRQAVGGATDPQLHSNRTVIHFKREYLVQLYYTRGRRPGAPQNTWSTADLAGGRACRPASTGPNSAQAPEGLRPQPGDYTIIKPRWSAFFQTELDLILRRLGVRTVILTGTTTPNCVRTTCYDAIALEYNTVVLTDCCSSHTEEIQRVNLEDMARAGAILMDSASFADYGPGTVEDLSAAIRARMLEEDTVPEPFRSEDGQVFWPDLW